MPTRAARLPPPPAAANINTPYSCRQAIRLRPSSPNSWPLVDTGIFRSWGTEAAGQGPAPSRRSRVTKNACARSSWLLDRCPQHGSHQATGGASSGQLRPLSQNHAGKCLAGPSDAARGCINSHAKEGSHRAQAINTSRKLTIEGTCLRLPGGDQAQGV